MAWNDERVDLLKKLWSDGLSASQIAGRLGGVTRNAVIGKVHRLGPVGARHHLAHEIAPAARARAISRQRLMKPRFANIGNPALRQLYLGDTEPYTPPAEELVIPLNERKSIQTLTESVLPLADRRSAACRTSISVDATRSPACPTATSMRGVPSSRRSRAAAIARCSRRRDRRSPVPSRPAAPASRLRPVAEPKEKAAV